ncbi:MAG: hypothetical protein QNJ47_05170 [Nostocaceae cyanobacterium]|nr:hypothetical protein [Nostocaceae cyanobacterium]
MESIDQSVDLPDLAQIIEHSPVIVTPRTVVVDDFAVNPFGIYTPHLGNK